MTSEATILVLTTEADLEKAEALAEAALQQGLAACVALKAVHSLYLWKGELERSNEVQLLFKTSPACLEQLEALVRTQHSYDTPQWLHWPATASGDYAAWLKECCATN